MGKNILDAVYENTKQI